MDDDLLAVRSTTFQNVMREEAFGHAGEGIGAARAEGHDLLRRSSGNVLIDRQAFHGDIQRL